jgi:hypothetical protein
MSELANWSELAKSSIGFGAHHVRFEESIGEGIVARHDFFLDRSIVAGLHRMHVPPV